MWGCLRTQCRWIGVGWDDTQFRNQFLLDDFCIGEDTLQIASSINLCNPPNSPWIPGLPDSLEIPDAFGRVPQKVLQSGITRMALKLMLSKGLAWKTASSEYKEAYFRHQLHRDSCVYIAFELTGKSMWQKSKGDWMFAGNRSARNAHSCSPYSVSHTDTWAHRICRLFEMRFRFVRRGVS